MADSPKPFLCNNSAGDWWCRFPHLVHTRKESKRIRMLEKVRWLGRKDSNLRMADPEFLFLSTSSVNGRFEFSCSSRAIKPFLIRRLLWCDEENSNHRDECTKSRES